MKITSWLKQLFSRRRLYDDLSAEIRQHLEEKIEELVATGMSRKDATHAARRQFGNLTLIENDSRSVWQWPSLESFFADVRYALRTLRKNPGFASVAVLSLGLGIGATIAIFSVIYVMALRPLPVRQPDRLVEIARGDGVNGHSYAEWKEFRDRQDVFSSVLAYNWFDTTFTITNLREQQEIYGLYVTGDYFPTLGVSAVLGRVLQPLDDQAGAPPVCVIGSGLWRQSYGQSNDVLRRVIRVNGNAFQIVGVLPRYFFGVDIGSVPEVFMPLEAERTFKDYHIIYGRQSPPVDSPHAWLLSIVGRLKQGVNVSQANAGLRVLSPEIYAALPPRSNESGARSVVRAALMARPMTNGTSDTWHQAMNVVLLLMVMAAAALVIVCANLGNLLLARAAKRRNEIATRLALGATRWRLIRQLLTESAALSVAGAATGLIIARWGTQALLWALSYPGEPILLDLSWDVKLVAFAVSITLGCALLFGLAPAFEATQISVYSAMKNGVTTGKRSNRFMNSGLVVVQVALSVALLVSAGLLTRTLQALLAKYPGYDPKGVVVAHVSMERLAESPQREAIIGKEILTEFRSLPRVTSASWTRRSSKMTLSHLVVARPGESERRSGSYPIFVSPDYFKTQRTPILAGREFNDRDTDSSVPVAILSEDLAKALFGEVNPVGLRFREDDGDENGHYYSVEVVAIARDIQYRRPSDGPLPILFRPVAQCGGSCSGIGDYQVRTAGVFAETAKRLEAAAAAVDPHIVLKCEPLSDAISNSVHRNRAMALVATTFSLFVGLLAIVGVYGVTSHAAAERTREIGIRMALGANRGDVFRMLVGEMMRVVCIGILFGVAVGHAAAQLIRGSIWGVKPSDPLSLGFAICLMLLIAGIAAFLPTRRAMRGDPMVALRYE